MDAKQLREMLEKAVKDVDALKAKNASLQSTIDSKNTELDEAINALNSKFDGAVTQEKLTELQDEISDLRSKQKPITSAIPEDVKAQFRAIAGGAIGGFVAQKKREGGIKSDSLGEFMTIAASGVTEKLKALNIATPESGGLAIAEILGTDVLDYARDSYPILGEVGHKPSMTRSYRQLINLGGTGVRRGGENADGTTKIDPDTGKYVSTATQTYAEVKSNVFQVSAEPLVSDHAMSAPDINIYSDLIVDLGIEVGEWLATDITLGNGAIAGGDGEARGILGSRLDIAVGGESWKPTRGAAGTRRSGDIFPAYATGVADNIGTDDVSKTDFLLKLMRQLPKRYRKGAKLYMNENTFGVYERIRDANDRPVFRITYMDNGDPQLNGKPVVLDDNMPDVGADAPFIMYGNLALAYVINSGDVEKMQINPYIVRGATVVEYDKEMLEMIQRSDAIIIGVATTKGLV